MILQRNWLEKWTFLAVFSQKIWGKIFPELLTVKNFPPSLIWRGKGVCMSVWCNSFYKGYQINLNFIPNPSYFSQVALWGYNKHEQFFSSMIETQLQLFDIQTILLKPAGGAKFFEVFLKTAECGRFVFAHFQNEKNKHCYTYHRGKFWRFWKYTCYREFFD